MPTEKEIDCCVNEFKEDPNLILYENRVLAISALADWMETQPDDIHKAIFDCAQKFGFKPDECRKSVE